MKKIDLHIHTKSTISDSDFSFSIEKLKEYVETLSIDCIAITNHNSFDIEQFREICNEIPCKVLPGIEIDIEKGHLLLIAEKDELEDFESKCNKIEALVTTHSQYISTDQLRDSFGDLSKYLLIPHCEKDKALGQDIIEELGNFITAGEVGSPKKFIYYIKDSSKLVPVLFSDLRFSYDMKKFSPRQTFIGIDDTSLKAIKVCLSDKEKVSLVPTEGHSFFQVFENGQILSNGLNVILGNRSSGKSFTLKRIFNNFENIKFIEQFELLEKNEEKDKKKFNDLLTTKQSSVSEEYLKEFREVLEDVNKIDRIENSKKIESYLDSLLRVASEEEKKDVYSKCSLFNESKFIESNNDTLNKMIEATELLINNTEYRDVIDMHVSRNSLIELFKDLVYKYRDAHVVNQKKLWINSIIYNVKSELQSNTAYTSIDEIDFYKIILENKKLDKYSKLVNSIKKEKNIRNIDVRRFKIVANTRLFNGAQELLDKFGKKAKFKSAFDNYDDPIKYLEELKQIDSLPETEYYRYFIEIEYKILNEFEIEVSGGERSEFNLLEKIQNAHHFDMLLIDEPESSFDNLFLKNEVNEQIKEIAKSIPVVIVTHNNTVGASIKPDYLLYTKKEIIEKKPIFKIFSGYPSDNELKTINGEVISNYEIMLNCLEAGEPAYNQRGKSYEILKN